MGYLESEELIGHDALRGFLARSLKNKRHHAFLLAGAEHLGKDTVAKALVADELNRPVKDWAELAGHPDVRVLSREEGEKNISIAMVRDFISHFSTSSMWGGRKVGVISGAHDLSLEAANALLKTLEEPSGKALLVLTAHHLDRLPDTIKSRCQLVRFLAVPTAALKAGLVRRGLDAKVAEASAAFSAGRPGLAVLHAQDADLRQEYADRVESLIAMANQTVSGRLTAAGEITAKAEAPNLGATLDAWTAVLRDILSMKTGNVRYAADPAVLDRLRPYAARRNLREIIAAVRTVGISKRLLAENVNPRLVFENIALAL